MQCFKSHFVYKNAGVKTSLKFQDKWSWAIYAHTQPEMEAWPSLLTTREKGQFSKHLCLFRNVNNIVFKRSLGCRSKALQGFCSFLYSVGRHMSDKSHSLKRQVMLNTGNVAVQRNGHCIWNPGCNRARLLLHPPPGTTQPGRGFLKLRSQASTWDGAALLSAQSKTDPSPSALPEHIPQARYSLEGLGTLPFECEIYLVLVS